METVTISQRTGFRRQELLWMLGLWLGGGAAGVVLSYLTRTSHPELSKALTSGATTVLFGALLGGIVSLLLAELDRWRLRRAAEIEYLTNILAELKAVYDQVDRGRTLIAAHKSAKTYGDEMRNLIQARVRLLQVLRALKFDARRRSAEAVLTAVKDMEDYLKKLVDEFEANYKDISREQSVYEAQMKSVLAKASTGSVDLPLNTPWDQIVALPQIADLLQPLQESETGATVGQSAYCRQFLNQLDDASLRLRDALEAQLADHPRATERGYG